jgi:hypothetical protein
MRLVGCRLFITDLDYVASNGRVNDEWSTGKNLEGSGNCLIDLLSRNFPVGTEETHDFKNGSSRNKHFYFVSVASMLCGSLVTTAWRVLRLRMEEAPSTYGGWLRIY